MEEFISKYALAIVSCAAILLWFLIFTLKSFKASIKENPFGDYEEPRNIATLGVLFTFIGISWGLMDFNPEQSAIYQSVINLLGGMTTAFFTSILGMGLSMYLKYLQAEAQKNFPKNEVDAAATVADLIGYLKKSDAEKSAATQNLLNAVEKMTATLAGDSDYTVIGQIKTIRLELRDHHDKIISEFREFAKTLAENNTKAFIEALNEAIKDFNTKLTEQFGENFKQLNIAVGRLLEWQENYKSTLETVTENLEVAAAGMDAAKNSLVQIENSSAAVASTAATIQDLIVTANLYAQKLEQVLAEVAKLGDSAKNSVPQIINLVETSCNEIQKTTSTATINVDALSEKIHASTIQAENNLANFVETSCAEMQKTTSTAAANVDALSEKIHASTIQAQINLANFVESSCDEMQKTTATAAANVDALSEKFNSTTEKTQANIINIVQNSCSEIEKSAAAAAQNSNTLSYEIYSSITQAQNNLKNFVESSCSEIQKTTSTAAENFNDLSDEIHIAIGRAQEFSEQISETANDAFSEFDDFSRQAVQSMQEVSKRLESTSYKQREIMDAEVQATKNAVQKAAATLGEDALKITRNISDSLYNMMKTNNENLQKSTENLNKNLENVLKESLEEIGDTMYKVSERFARDYTPVADRLTELVNFAAELEGRFLR